MGSGLPGFPQGSSCPVVLRNGSRSHPAFAYRALTLSGGPFQCPSTSWYGCHSSTVLRHGPLPPSTPAVQRPQSIPHTRFGLLPFRSPLLREYSLFLRVLRCFSSPRAPHLPIDSVGGACSSNRRVSPFGYPRLSRLHTARRGFSQCTTSFFGS